MKFRKVVDVKREKELDARRKNEKLTLPMDHPVRKLLFRMRERHGSRIYPTTMFADIEKVCVTKISALARECFRTFVETFLLLDKKRESEKTDDIDFNHIKKRTKRIVKSHLLKEFWGFCPWISRSKNAGKNLQGMKRIDMSRIASTHSMVDETTGNYLSSSAANMRYSLVLS